ncbi:MAG: FAD:protein FMN transferase [Acidimicrobiales bacterium]|nr:FAD:protein FMN transferase [Acidimicrobiales bacterium]
MTRRLLVGYLLITLFVLVVHDLPFGISMAGAERDRLISATQRDAAVLATYVVDALEQHDAPEIAASMQNYSDRTNARVVVVDTGGVVAVDTQPGIGTRFRADTAVALTGHDLGDVRDIEGEGPRVEVAVPAAAAGTVHGAVWVSTPWTTPWPWRKRLLVLGVADLVTLVAVGVFGRLVAQSVSSPLRSLRAATAALAQGKLDRRAQVEGGPPEVQELAHSFNVMADRLAELVDAQRSFVADASHQLRTPLTALKLQLRQATGLTDDVDVLVSLDHAVEETNRLHRLVEGLLALARADGARPQSTVQPLGVLVDGRVRAWEALAEERGVRLVTSGPQHIDILAVPGSMEQIIDNLIDNALEVAPTGSDLVLRTVDRGSDAVELHIIDAGPGLSELERRHAFTRFWTRRCHGTAGTGLGLAIVKQLAVANDGSARLDAAPGGGIDAVITVPRAAPRRPGHAAGGRAAVGRAAVGRVVAAGPGGPAPSRRFVRFLARPWPMLGRRSGTVAPCTSGSINEPVSAMGSARSSVPTSSSSTGTWPMSARPAAPASARATPRSPSSPTDCSTPSSKPPTNVPGGASMSSTEAGTAATVDRRVGPNLVPEYTRDTPVVAERIFGVMGSTGHLLVVVERGAGEDPVQTAARAEWLLDEAQERLAQLEQRWSRFVPTSEVSALNRAEGVALTVSSDTLELLARCVQAWRSTGGLFDPSVHDAMLRLGYDRSAELLTPPGTDPAPVVPTTNGPGRGARSPGCGDIDLDRAARTVRFGPGVAIDPGGIGKGLAGDLLVAELLAAGAAGAMVNLGGDTVVAGRPPRLTGWQIGVADPHAPATRPDALCAVVGLSVGAVATSTRLERRWEHEGALRHHLVDPATGAPVEDGIDAVTVMASAGWWAEALAKACFVGGADRARELLRNAGATGLMVHSDGRIETFEGLEVYLR